MAGLEDLTQAVGVLREQQAALVQEAQRLAAENQVLRAAQPQSLDPLVQALGQAVQALTLAASSGSGGRQSLIDVKGLGKPPVFRNDAGRFVEWFRKTTGFLVAAYGAEFRAVLEWIEDQDQGITLEDLKGTLCG